MAKTHRELHIGKPLAHSRLAIPDHAHALHLARLRKLPPQPFLHVRRRPLPDLGALPALRPPLRLLLAHALVVVHKVQVPDKDAATGHLRERVRDAVDAQVPAEHAGGVELAGRDGGGAARRVDGVGVRAGRGGGVQVAAGEGGALRQGRRVGGRAEAQGLEARGLFRRRRAGGGGAGGRESEGGQVALEGLAGDLGGDCRGADVSEEDGAGGLVEVRRGYGVCERLVLRDWLVFGFCCGL